MFPVDISPLLQNTYNSQIMEAFFTICAGMPVWTDSFDGQYLFCHRLSQKCHLAAFYTHAMGQHTARNSHPELLQFHRKCILCRMAFPSTDSLGHILWHHIATEDWLHYLPGQRIQNVPSGHSTGFPGVLLVCACPWTNTYRTPWPETPAALLVSEFSSE